MKQYEIRLACIGILLTAVTSNGQRLTTTNAPAAIPWNQVGVKARADYKGDGLAVIPAVFGARLHCVFQRLDGEATSEGLWLTSTVTNKVSERFRVTAMEIGREPENEAFNSWRSESNIQLTDIGNVSVEAQMVRFVRLGLREEYSVSMDGVRQDFVVTEKPPGVGQLKLRLSVSGALVQPATYGAQLTLLKSGRKIAYSRLRAVDAKGKELSARIEANQKSKRSLDVIVNDAGAVYPLRIDPTFSDANWISMGGTYGADGEVTAAVMDSWGNLYIGGSFVSVGTTFATNIAKWNGDSWAAMGSGLDGQVYALAVSGNTIYAGGDFTTAGGNSASNIAQWNGSSWAPLGAGMNGVVNALAVSGGTLYAGGEFWTAGGNAANDIAQWNGTNWSPLGSGMQGEYPFVFALAASGGNLYAGGEFTNAGGTSANCIAQWNGSTWSPLGPGIGQGAYTIVYALALSGGVLYAGGGFTMAGGNPANNVAQWNGTSWSPLGSGIWGEFSTYVTSLAVSGGSLFAGGFFAAAGDDADLNYVAQWNGSSWSPVGTDFGGQGVVGEVEALAVSGGTLYAGGDFSSEEGSIPNYIAQWNGGSWLPLGSAGLNREVIALAVLGTTLYVGGQFTAAGGYPVDFIAQWNGNSWSHVGYGLNGWVSSLAVSGGTLYAGGYFSETGDGYPVNCIAQWDGTNWSALGSGLTGDENIGPDSSGTYVSAIVVSGGTLYAAGNFTTAGNDTNANCIAQWNGSSWSSLDSGVGGDGWYTSVAAIALSGDTLYVGGEFATAGGIAADNIAQWNGSTWSPLGSGVGPGDTGAVEAMAVSGSTLFVGGFFTNAGGMAATNIAQWNGSTWSPLGSGLGGGTEFVGPYVSALAVSGGTLYAGGGFTTAGDDTNANYIAQWNGSTWSSLGSGMNDGVSALAVSGNALYVGGNFTTAGGLFSACAATAIIGPTVQYTANPTNGAAPLTVQFNSPNTDSSDSSIGSWNWNFGDGGVSAKQNPSHTYTNSGVYSPFLVVSNDTGLQIIGIGPQITVTNTIVQFTANPQIGVAPLVVQFNCPSADSSANGIVNWNWNFGDGGASTLQNPLHTYTRAGVYSPALVVTNIIGIPITATGPEIIVANATVQFSASPTNGAVPLIIQFNSPSMDSSERNIVSWNWNFGDGGASTLEDPSHTFTTSGVYSPVLVVIDSSGSSITATGPQITVTNGSSTNGSNARGSWSALGPGVNGLVDALTVSSGTLYVGGSFTNAGGATADYIAQWNGSSWSPEGSGLGCVQYPFVSALTISDGTLYAGGGFTTADDAGVINVVQWNGNTWMPLGSGMEGGNFYGPYVNALIASGGTLYVGGNFTTASGTAANFIAQWNGSSWSPLGLGMGGSFPLVGTLAVSGGTLYAGGTFTTAGGNAANFVAQWNGVNWSSVGSGMNGQVEALAVWGTNLYAGGTFTTAGGNPANYIAQWNGSSWSPLGLGISGGDLNGPFVTALAVSGGMLYVGGDFTTAGGAPANYIAQWNGTNWAALGSGMNSVVNTLAVSGGMLYAGGTFSTAGGAAANYIAQWNISSGVPLQILNTNGLFGFTNGQFQFTVTGPSGSSAVVQASTNLQSWTALLTNQLNLGSFNFMDTLATNYPARYYRALLSQ